MLSGRLRWGLFGLLLWPCSVSATVCTLAWDANTETDLGGYWVYHGLQSGVYGPALGVIGVGATPTTTCDTWGIVADNQMHFFVVSAFNASGAESAKSNEVSKYLATNVTPKTDTTTAITSITGSNIVGQPYSVSYAVSPGGTGTVTVTDGTGASCSSAAPTGSCSLTSTTAGTKTITAAYGGDTTYNASQGTTSYAVTTHETSPNPPSNMNAIMSSAKVNKQTVYSSTMSWTDNSVNESGFKLQRFTKTPKGCTLDSSFKATVGIDVTSYKDSTPTANTCGYGVAAYNSAGASTFVTDYTLAQ